MKSNIFKQLLALSMLLASPLGAINMAKRPFSETVATIMREPSASQVGLPTLASIVGFGTFFGGIQAFNSSKRSDQLFWGLVSGVSAIVTPGILNCAKTLDLNKKVVIGAAIGGCLLGVAAAWYKNRIKVSESKPLAQQAQTQKPLAPKPAVKLVKHGNMFYVPEESSQLATNPLIKSIYYATVDHASLSTDREYVCVYYRTLSDEKDLAGYIKIFKIYNTENKIEPKEVVNIPLEQAYNVQDILLETFDSRRYTLYINWADSDTTKKTILYYLSVNMHNSLALGTTPYPSDKQANIESKLTAQNLRALPFSKN